MITGELRGRIDKLWEAFWTGGITNPLTVIEQISFLMFARLLDITESRNEKKAKRLGKPLGKPLYRPDEQHLRWHRFIHAQPETMVRLLRDEVFPHFKGIGNGSRLGEYMKDAQLLIQKPSLLVQAVNMVESLPLTEGDTKGDLYEYLLSKLTTAGINGQFRTPRHVIRLMVELVDPQPHETVGDPACGTAGFLVSALQYVEEKHSSLAGTMVHEDGSRTFSGDLIPDELREHVSRSMLHGFDFDITMLRTAAMNLLLHGVEHPGIHYQDTLAKSFSRGDFRDYASDRFDVVLANPPFTGSIDLDTLDPSLHGQVKTKKTELLFVVRILKMLRMGGRAAVIVPEGVLFGSSTAHKALRRILVEEQQLDAVVALPSGVFRPYAGVSTAILLFTRTDGGGTENVWFYRMEADGISLDDKRNPLLPLNKLGPDAKLTPEEHAKNNLPDIVARWKSRKAEAKRARIDQSFLVPKSEIASNGYDLSVNRYREVEYEQVKTDPPKKIIKELLKLEEEIQQGLKELEGMLK